MSRDATLTDTKLSRAQIYPVLLVFLDWPNTPVRVWAGMGTLVWGGQSWLGVGDLGGISPVQESMDGAANGITLAISGVKATNVVEVLDNRIQGKSAKIYLGMMTTVGEVAGTWDVEPYCVFDGLIDTADISSNGETSTISVKLEKEFIDSRSQSRRYTDQDQKIDYPTDRGFEFVAGIANKTVLWGRVQMGLTGGGTAGGSGGGGGGGLYNYNEP